MRIVGAILEKSSSAFRTISEVADELDVPKHVLRFWEGKFNQLKPMKRGGGRRYYRPEDVDLLRGIRWLLYSDGYTIKGVQRILRDSGVRFVKTCWQEGAHGDGEPAGAAPMDIPNLAGEAASEAQRPSLSRKSGLGASAEKAEKGAADQRAMLFSLVRDLEECRDILQAAARDGEPQRS
jgi:DNA-binding transcriptional MerR regulator